MAAQRQLPRRGRYYQRLAERTFDTITCNLGLLSFADRGAALGAIWRLLRPEGQFLMTLPLQSALREFLDTFYLTLRDLKLDDAMRAFAQLTSARPTTEQARMLVERAGFEVRRVVTDNFTCRFPDPKAFLGSPLIQTTYMPGWRGSCPTSTGAAWSSTRSSVASPRACTPLVAS